MIPTIHGLITLLLGLWLLRKGSPLALLCAMLALGLFEASAAAILPVLGNASIPPARMMLAFLLLAVFQQVRLRASLLGEAVVANAAFVVFALYGLIGALLLPRIFAGQIDVVPMRPVGLRSLLDAFPLAYSPQNVTTGVYIVGSALTAIAAYVAGRLAEDVRPIARTCAGIALAHAITGMMGVFLAGTPWDQVVAFIRNGTYAQITQSVGGFMRINGFMPEASAFARFGIVWMIFSTELWLRDVNARWTGIAALALAMVLVLSSSSTSYVAMGTYALIIALRLLAFPAYLRADKVMRIAFIVIAGIVVALLLILLSERLAEELTGIFQRMTVEKAGSVSGQQRKFWAMQGIEAFKFSWGLGIGAGSFRSSSLATAILGSLGVVGAVSFLAYCAGLFGFARLTPANGEEQQRFAVAAAAAWAAVAGLMPAMVMQASPDPGMEFAALAGLALALRRPALAPSAGHGVRRFGWGQAGGLRQAVPNSARSGPRSIPRW